MRGRVSLRRLHGSASMLVVCVSSTGAHGLLAAHACVAGVDRGTQLWCGRIVIAGNGMHGIATG